MAAKVMVSSPEKIVCKFCFCGTTFKLRLNVLFDSFCKQKIPWLGKKRAEY